MTPFWSDETTTLHLGDCLEVLPSIPDGSVDAIVTDPPYGLAELSAATTIAAIVTWASGDRCRVPDGRGFMGREWDRFVPPPGAWDECMRVLKPGGHLLAFAGSRTVDLMTLSIRIAGFEIRDSISWLYGSGFPKSLDVSKAIDKRDGNDGAWFAEWLAEKRAEAGLSRNDVSSRFPSKSGGVTGKVWNWEHGHGIPTQAEFDALCDLLGTARMPVFEAEREAIATRRGITSGYGPGDLRTPNPRPPISAPATEGAARWEGWGTALKPGHEPIVVARKPLAGTVAANVLEHCTGALNIDGCRVGSEARVNQAGGASSLQRVSRVEHGYRPTVTESRNEDTEVIGRWPPNVLLTHSADCEPAGTREVRSDGHHPAARGEGGYEGGWGGQSGLAERKSGTETVEAWDCATGCPVAELDRQSGTLTSGANPTRRGSDKFRDAYGDFAGQRECTPSRGVDSGGASRFFPAFQYEAKAPATERPRLEDGTAHPTVKPVDLMRWLVRLVTPPGGVVLDPFAGSGTTGEACIIEGFRSVLIERDPRYAELIMARLRKPIQPDLFGGAA